MGRFLSSFSRRGTFRYGGRGNTVIIQNCKNTLDRIEDSETGKILIPSFHTDIGQSLKSSARDIARVVGDGIWADLPVVDTLTAQSEDVAQMLLDVNWRPALSVIGADGLPPVQTAGNVLRTAPIWLLACDFSRS